jgi:hypothetical protein
MSVSGNKKGEGAMHQGILLGDGERHELRRGDRVRLMCPLFLGRWFRVGQEGTVIRRGRDGMFRVQVDGEELVVAPAEVAPVKRRLL